MKFDTVLIAKVRDMKNNVNNFGRTAGKIWKALEKYGPLDENDLIRKIKLKRVYLS